MSTIGDVCKLAGVSKTTVSRVINGTGQVKQSTQDIVKKAMTQLGYRPNSLAQTLARNQTNTIGLVVSDFQNAYFSTLLKQTSATAKEVHKELMVTDGHNDAELEYEAIQRLEDHRCDAIVLYSRKMSEAQLQTLKNQLSVPLVLINRQLEEPLFHTVTFDQAGAVQMMLNNLISYGHRKIACITGPTSRISNQTRLDAYQATLKNHAIPYNTNIVINSDYEIQGGYDACQTLLRSKEPFSAIFAFNDDMALGALKALTEAGISVPEQISIAGIDNIPMARFSNPALSTVYMPIQEMTKRAVEIALSLAAGKNCPLNYQFNGTLIQRDSVLPINSVKQNWFNY
jgi:DNA-binding LacI/PurR family transcriptional regulator